MVECYIEKEENRLEKIKDVISFSLSRMTETAWKVGKVARILMRLSTYPDSSQRLEREKVVARLIREVPNGGSRKVSLPCAEIEVQEITGQPDDNFFEDGTLNESGQYAASAHVCFLQSSVPSDQLMHPIDEPSFPSLREKLSQVFLWLPPQKGKFPEERILELSDRVDEKLRQTKTKGKRGKQIVIAQIPEGVGRGWNKYARMIARGIQERLVPKRKEIAAIILTSRVWTPEYRFRYLYFLLSGMNRDEIVDEICQKIGEVDFSFDLLHDYHGRS